jgi:hypothetical protein
MDVTTTGYLSRVPAASVQMLATIITQNCSTFLPPFSQSLMLFSSLHLHHLFYHALDNSIPLLRGLRGHRDGFLAYLSSMTRKRNSPDLSLPPLAPLLGSI